MIDLNKPCATTSLNFDTFDTLYLNFDKRERVKGVLIILCSLIYQFVHLYLSSDFNG